MYIIVKLYMFVNIWTINMSLYVAYMYSYIKRNICINTKITVWYSSFLYTKVHVSITLYLWSQNASWSIHINFDSKVKSEAAILCLSASILWKLQL